MAFKCQRWTLANILPVAFVTWVICTIWLLYSWLHLHPLLQIGWPAAERDEDAYHRGLVQTIFSQTVTALLLICFGRAVCTDPGTVPETAKWAADGIDPKLTWSSSGQAETDRLIPEVHEVKQSGARRFCKWCNSYKPDRCHHCRVCKSCILRMDHHCPWIANCVGFRNHKYFFLLVFYALINCGFISVTISESLFRALEYHTTSLHRFLLVFGMTLSVIMGFLLAMFFMLHVWLMLQATTTIEFCEKKTKHLGKDSAGTTTTFDHGLYRNIQAVLGPMPIFWLLPIMPPSGQGLSFDVRNEKTSAKDQGSEAPESGENETSALLAAHRKEQSLCQQNEDITSTEPEKVSAGIRDTTYGGKEVFSGHAAKAQAASCGDATPPEVTGRGAATV